MLKLANQLPACNSEDDFSDVDDLVLHGPSWTNWMPFDAHARQVLLPWLLANNWHIRVSGALRRIDAITPWAPETIQ
jgi:hypothetical protein